MIAVFWVHIQLHIFINIIFMNINFLLVSFPSNPDVLLITVKNGTKSTKLGFK